MAKTIKNKKMLECGKCGKKTNNKVELKIIKIAPTESELASDQYFPDYTDIEIPLCSECNDKRINYEDSYGWNLFGYFTYHTSEFKFYNFK